jgi:hypothetical protein
MAKSGCYDLDGKCVNCGQFHPCSCEIVEEQIDKAIKHCEDIPNEYGDDSDFEWVV